MFQQILTTNRPTAALKRTLWDDVKKASYSSNAIARTVHSNSNRAWSVGEDTALVTRFAALVLEKAGQGRTFKQASSVQRKAIIEALSLEFHRSPMAIRIRAKNAGLIVTASPTPVVPTVHVPSVSVSVETPTSLPVSDPTMAAIIAAMQSNASKLAEPTVGSAVVPPQAPTQAEVPVAPRSTATTAHTFGNSALNGLYGA